MKRTLRFIVAALAVAVVIPALTGLASQTAAVPTVPAPPASMAMPAVPAGSTLRIRLRTTLTSKTNQTGDTFSGEVVQPIVVDGKEVVPTGSLVDGHVAFIKAPGRIKGKAAMRIVIDHVITPDDVKYNLSAGLDSGQVGPCAKTGSDEEGTIKGCGKSKKDAAKDSAIGAAMGAGAGASVGLAQAINCDYFGNCGGPGFGTDVAAGAGIGAGTVLIYNLLKKQKDVILIEGNELTFVVNRTANADPTPPTASASSPPAQ